MLIEFSVANFLSFKDKVTLSMVASNDDSLPQNVIKSAQGTDLNLLKSAVIYGANASGKSNFIKAMLFMEYFISNSAKEVKNEVPTNRKCFKLDESYSTKPSEFEIVFLKEGIRYVYGFKIDDTSVLEEWYYFYPKGQQVLLFDRTSNTGNIDHGYKFGKQFKGEKTRLAEHTKKHSLFITVASQFNNEMTQIVVDWFFENIWNINSHSNNNITVNLALKQVRYKNMILEFMKGVGIDIEDFEIEKNEIRKSGHTFNVDENNYSVSMIHRGKDSKKGNTNIPIDFEDESDGTQKLFSLAGAWSLVLGLDYLMISDEFDLHLHPLLAENMINSFNSDSGNKNNAQLIITTHNTELLDKNIFRRDQVWFTEKSNETGASSLYSLWDFKKNKPRGDDNFRKKYLAGRFGAIPILSKFD